MTGNRALPAEAGRSISPSGICAKLRAQHQRRRVRIQVTHRPVFRTRQAEREREPVGSDVDGALALHRKQRVGVGLRHHLDVSTGFSFAQRLAAPVGAQHQTRIVQTELVRSVEVSGDVESLALMP